MLKICFVGLGSIGKRHIKNLACILRNQKREFVIDAVRSTEKILPIEIADLIHNFYYSVEELKEIYDIIFITNPTIYHYNTIKHLMSYTQNMFIEKPVFHEYQKSLNEMDFNARGIYYVACPLRYGAVIAELKRRLINETVYSVHAISSSYLPDWRKGVNYRDVYSAHKDMGGGVTLDLIHELDYITWMFGFPEKSHHLCGKYSDLEIDSDDLSVYLLEYKDKIVEIHTDYFGRENVRKIELFCRDYVIKGDLQHNTLQYVYSDGKIEEIKLAESDTYMCEMESFLDMIDGKRINDNDIVHANNVLKIALDN